MRKMTTGEIWRIAAVLAVLVVVAATAVSCKKRPRRRSLPPDAGLSGGELIFEEDFEEGLANWTAKSKNWKVVDGKLYTGDKPNDNKGLWLTTQRLPRNFRVEFEATSVKGKRPVFEGDMKCEFGGPKNEHASGYMVIFGGWKNTVNTIARHDEHGEGRLATENTHKVKEGTTYDFRIVRMGSEIKWFLGSELVLRVDDKEPALGGVFGFNNWDSRVYFDNLRVYAL